MHFPQAFFSFQCTFVSDQKEDELLTVGLDLHYGRQVRHREKFTAAERLADQPALPLPDANHPGLAARYPLARDEALRTVATLAHNRARESHDRLEHQTARMQRDYGDLRRELDAPPRGRDSEEARARRGGAVKPLAVKSASALPSCARKTPSVYSSNCPACS